ncbi:MAG: DUF4404 family protein [Planctomycetota bacterium]
MPERIEKLREIVKQLETELDSLDPLDAESRQVLEEALKELRSALGQTDTASLQSESLFQRLRDAEEHFQVSHPTISGLVLRMINGLGQLGI